MSTTCKMFASLPPSLPSSYVPEIRRQSMGRLFGFSIQAARTNAGLSIEDAARLSGMELTEWMGIEDGSVPREVNQLRVMAETMQVNFDKIASMVLVCRDAWEL